MAAGSSQMAKVSTSQGFKSDLMYKVSVDNRLIPFFLKFYFTVQFFIDFWFFFFQYVERLSKTLPEILDTVYLCNSGSEANDLAIR